MHVRFYRLIMAFVALLAFATASVMPFTKSVEAAKTPELIWAEELLLVSDETNQLLVSGGDETLKGNKKKIIDAISKKLYAARDAGKLPFTLKEGAESYEYEGVMTDVDEEVPVALIPLAIMSDALHAKYQVQDKSYYKSIVVGSLYLAVCRGGSTANNWTMVGGIPLSGYVILGDDLNNLLTTKPSKLDEANAYVSMMETVIDRDLNFDDLKKALQNLNSKKVPDTYEVMDVALSSKKAPEIFGNQQGKIKALLGTFYSAKFQELSKGKVTVYPPVSMIGKNTGGNMANAGNRSAADDVSDTLFSLTGGKSTSGATMTLSMPEPAHKINLNFAGAGWQELKTKEESSVVKNIGYQALLKMQLDNQAEKSSTDVKSVQYIIPPSGSIAELEQERLPDIYTELLIRLADNIASGKK